MLDPLGLFIALAIACAAYPLGRAVLGILLENPPGGLEGVVWNTALGLGLQSQAILVLGFTGGLYPLRMLAMVAFLASLGTGLCLAIAGAGRGTRARAIRDPLPSPMRSWTWADKLLLAVVVAHLGLAAVAALSPPVAPDAISYHFSLPKQYLLDGRII